MQNFKNQLLVKRKFGLKHENTSRKNPWKKTILVMFVYETVTIKPLSRSA